MVPNTDYTKLDIIEDVSPRLSLHFKEYFFLVIIFLMGFSGMTLCIDKLFPDTSDDIQNIIIHESDFAHLK